MKEEQIIEDLLKEGESEQLEFREVVRKEDIAKVLCSFLNGKGGRLLLGVSDKGKVLGLPDAFWQLEQLKIYLLSAIIPEAPITISTEHAEGKELLMLKVYGGSRQPYLFDGSIYYRKNATTVKATSQQISELIHGRQNSELHWERHAALGVDLENLDNKLILATLKESQENHRGNYKSTDVIDFLSYYGLFQNGSFTNASVVLFAKNPATYIPQIRVRLTEYAEGKTDNALLRDEIFEDNLFTIQNKLERYINGLGVRSVFDRKQWKRTDFMFPVKALQEGVINALMHRDYSSPSSSISISVYAQSFVISNSGHLPDDIKVSDLKKSHRSHPVNPDIAHIVFLRGLIDKLGRGTVKLVEECRAAGLKDPSWKDAKDGVILTFNGPKAHAAKKDKPNTGGANDGLNSEEGDSVNKRTIVSEIEKVAKGLTDTVFARLVTIANIIKDNPGTKVVELLRSIDISERVLKQNIKILVDAGLIIYEGSKKTGGYYPGRILKEST